jgi:hypothetical protein
VVLVLAIPMLENVIRCYRVLHEIISQEYAGGGAALMHRAAP